MDESVRSLAKIALILVIGVLGIICIVVLDKASDGVYNQIHQHMCFERIVKEPWEVEPLGRIEQVGIKRLLVTMGRDRKPVAADDAYAYGFAMTKDEFNREYKEVICPLSKP